MKTVTRSGVFETNSSSSHSLTYENTNGVMFAPDYLKPNLEGFIEVPAMEFGWGHEEYQTPLEKLSYLVMQVISTESHECTGDQEVHELEGFKKISEAIASHCNCKGIVVPDLNFQSKSHTYEDITVNYTEHEGYVDHQSVCGLEGCISETDGSIIDYVFNPKNVLVISNDNM